MKKIKLTALILSLLMLAGVFSACKPVETESNGNTSTDSEESTVKIPDEAAKQLWTEAYADAQSGFNSADDVYALDIRHDGVETSEIPTGISADDDYRYMFKGESATRYINLPEGYAITVPTVDYELDLTLGKLRSKYVAEDFVLTVTMENQNPYGNNENGWNIYLTEWLNIRIDDMNFLSSNMLRRTRAAQTVTDWIDGYEIMLYNMEIRDNKKIDMPYYDIAIIRKTGEYVEFFLVVMKSAEKNLDRFDMVVKSFTEIENVGTAKSIEKPLELIIPEYWSEETKAYYNKLMSSSTVDWGFFSGSLPDDSSSNYNTMLDRISTDQERLETSFEYDFDILPTYTHIGWYSELTGFPSKMAAELAGGNGFNGKPVLQFTYQFTTTNNWNLDGYTPMFDILRGEYDEHFKEIAQAIKAYGKPVLFRLNNEMNSDWTSYAGILTMLDPDIFIMTWERMYNIFLEEGVDNCIWIWNPNAISCPYSNWGEALNYLPGLEYVQALGLTYYEMNNSNAVNSFKAMYKQLYELNTPWFENYPWIISEFACGAGGEKLYDWGQRAYLDTQIDRNEHLQALWVREMFDVFNNLDKEENYFAKNIKGAVWFSVNDYATIDNQSYITNKLQITENLTRTIEEFKKGLAISKQIKQ